MNDDLVYKLIHAIDNVCTYRTNYMMEELNRVRREVVEEMSKREEELIRFPSSKGIFS
jgi:hypothetical protein